MSLKEQKELFVTGLHGTTPLELLLICSTAVSGILFFQATAKVSLPACWWWCPRWVWEAVAFWLPTMLCQTIWLYPYGVAYMVVQITVAILLVSLQATHRRRLESDNSPAVAAANDTFTATSNFANDTQRLTVTVYRSGLMLLTMTAILAVDFHVFPRRWGKTETSGYSLMDLGAASFVIAAAIVSPRARSTSTSSSNRSSKSIALQPALTTFSKQMRRMLPLLFMGLLRLWTHKELEYQEHASEYGVHWNFFFTLALLSPLATMLSHGPVPSGTRPVGILVLYQLLLQTGLQEWVQEAPRSCPRQLPPNRVHAALLCEFWCANREGLVGCVSYACLYLISEWIAHWCFWKHLESSAQSSSRRLSAIHVAFQTTKRLWYAVIVLFGLWRVCVAMGINVSRRTTNAAFCLWALFVNLLQLAAIQFAVVWNRHCVGSASSSSNPPSILAAVNRNGLLMFVIANLLTGAVNLSMNTLQVSNGNAVGILAAYLGCVGLIAVTLEAAKKHGPTLLRKEASKQTKKD
jgi:glucosaminylphosphatidylinositol acyltransferase